MKKIFCVMLVTFVLTSCINTSRNIENYNGNSIYNTFSSGRVLEMPDESMYFTNSEEQKVYLHHVDKDMNTISKQVINMRSESSGLEYLNIVDDTLYGYDSINNNGFNHDVHSIIRINLDDTKDLLDSKVILEFELSAVEKTKFVLISNDRIYRMISDSEDHVSSLYSYNLKGNDEKNHGDLFYQGSYVSNGNIYRVGLGEIYQNDELLLSYENSDYFFHDKLIYEDYLYSYAVEYAQPNDYLLKAPIDGNDEHLMNEDEIEIIFTEKAIPKNFYEDRMVYWKNGNTYISKLDGSEESMISDDHKQVMLTINYIFIATQTGVDVYEYTGEKVDIN